MSGSRYTPIPNAEIEALLDRTKKELSAEVESLHLPHLSAVVLGGGYGRGEGGILHTPSGPRLYNDLDLFVFSEGADFRAAAEIDRKLRELSLRREKELGIAVDFGPAKNLSDIRKVGHTLMFQELLRGWQPVWGRVDLAQWIPQLDAKELPYSEAVRLLLNRGMGLVLAADRLRTGQNDPDFIVRNMNKAVLGGGDAVLIAAGEYRWQGADRVNAYADHVRREKLPEEYAAIYEKAFRWKLEPEPVLPSDPAAEWRKCRDFYLHSVRLCAGAPDGSPVWETTAGLRRKAAKERTLKNALRWLARTKSLRSPVSFFDPPVVSVLGMLYSELAAAGEDYPEMPQKLYDRWKFFN